MNKRKYLFFAIFLLGACLQLPLLAQEVTNAFLDLQRKGEVKEESDYSALLATAQEVESLTNKIPIQGYFCFTESRENDVRAKTHILRSWIDRADETCRSFEGICNPNEFYTFQVVIYTPQRELKNIAIEFGDLKNEKGDKIASSALNCFNLRGIDIYGKPFNKEVDIKKGEVQPLWIGLSTMPQHKGVYRGKAIIKPEGEKETEISIAIRVEGDAIVEKGDNEASRKSRLRWLDYNEDSKLSKITAPYTEIEEKNGVISYLGGELKLNSVGIPAQITTHYNTSNRLDKNSRNEILASEMQFVIETEKGIEVLKGGKTQIKVQNSATASWKSTSKSSNFVVTVNGTFDYDGFSNYQIEVKSLKEQEVKDIRLEVVYTEQASTYLMGLGKEGGKREKKNVDWKWDVSKHQDKIWIGGINCGINLRFKDEHFTRPLVNVYYAMGKLKEPTSWANGTKGGISMTNLEKGCALKAYSAQRTMAKGETKRFDFEMLITPVKPIDLKAQATDRIYHSNSDLSQNYIKETKEAGTNYITVHHKKDIYPYINYPYHDSSVNGLKTFIDEAHRENIKVRAYYTTRELTVKIPEIWALRSLGGEVIHDGPGENARTLIHPNGPNEWLCKNLKTNFIPAWYNAFNEGPYKGEMDISVITTPDSRWNNYYLAGLNWMVKNIGLDGVYIDDSALDRYTLQRARKILDEDGNKRLIDIHSWNHLNEYAGQVSSIHIYMDLLPYTDKIWMGEGFGDYHTPDFWLVEMSGIPFGLMSEMLDSQNRYRGMIFGMLPRIPWSGNPKELWKLWDSFSMKDATMKGFWDKSNPITSDNEKVRTTTYVNKEKALVVIANWNNQAENVKLQIDKELLGFEPSKVSLPEIQKIQWGEEKFNLTGTIRVAGEVGVIILLEK